MNSRGPALLVGLVLGVVTPARAQPSGEAYLTGAVSRQTSPVGNGTLGGFTLGFGIGSPTLVVGPELLFQSGDSLRLRAFAIAVRLRQGGGWLHPHLVVGLGAYSWQRLSQSDSGPFWREVSYLSGGLGGGVTVGPWRGTVTGVLEARWHRNIEPHPAEGSRSLVGVEAGLRLWW